MPSDYLHFAYHPNKFWSASLASRVRPTPNVNLQAKDDTGMRSRFRELCSAIATKQTMLEQVVRRIDGELQRLNREMAGTQEIDHCLRNNVAYTIADRHLPFEILVDVDSFLFESRSLYEIVGKFLQELFRQFTGRRLTEDKLKAALTSRRIRTRWIGQLREYRKLFFHETAPWLAARVASRAPLRIELIVLKSAVQNFTNPQDYIDFERLRDIYRGFTSSLPALRQWVDEQVRTLGQARKGHQRGPI